MSAPPMDSLPAVPARAARPATWRAMLPVAIGGVALGLAFPGYVPVGSALSHLLPLLAWIGLIPWFLAIGRTPVSGGIRSALWRDFLSSLALGMAFELTLNYWLLAMYPLNFLGLSDGVGALVVFVCWAGLASVFGVGIALAGTLYGQLVRRYLRADRPRWLLPVVGAAFWMLLEWAQTQGQLAYPWDVLAVSQTPYLPLLQILPYGGPYLLSGLIVFGGAAMAEARMGERRPLFAAGLLTAAAVAFGFFALKPTPVGTIRVAAVQGNFLETQKWSPGALGDTVDRYLKLSAQAPRAQLVVWPESAIPMYWNDSGSPLVRTEVSQIRAAFTRPGRYLLSGALFFRPRPTGGYPNLYNATTVVGPGWDGWQWEAKRHLVPFGEFMPFRGILPDVLAKLNVLTHDLTPGRHAHPFALPFATVGTGVCFDSIFPRTLAADVQHGATLLAIVTNDAWYKDTAAPHQSFAQSILRAVENRRFLVRAANTGVSGVIDPYGRVLVRTRTFVPAVATASVAALTGITPYTRIGDWPVLMAAMLVAFALAWSLVSDRSRA